MWSRWAESKLTVSVHLLDISVHFIPEISQKLFASAVYHYSVNTEPLGRIELPTYALPWRYSTI
jgi:hypothetical protein